MTNTARKLSLSGLLSAAALYIAFLLGGLLGGTWFATRLLQTSAMGWDQLGDALTGAATGAILALIASTLMLRRLTPRSRWIASLIALAAAALTLWLLQTTPPNTG